MDFARLRTKVRAAINDLVTPDVANIEEGYIPLPNDLEVIMDLDEISRLIARVSAADLISFRLVSLDCPRRAQQGNSTICLRLLPNNLKPSGCAPRVPEWMPL